MPQYARPDNDDSNSGWSPSTGTTLYSCIDEISYDDADYIRADVATEQCDIGLSAVSDPGIHTGHTVRYRAKATGSGGGEKLTVQLRSGVTLIATISNNITVARSWTQYSYTLTEAEASAITAGMYGGTLYLRFYVGTLGSGETVDVSWAEFEVPTGTVNILLDTAVITSTGVSLSVTKGAVSVPLDTALLTSMGVSLSVDTIASILLSTALLSANGVSLSVIPGEIATLLDTAILSAVAQAITIDAGALPVFVALSSATLTAVGESISIVPGSISTLLDTAILTAIGGSVSPLVGAISVLLSTAIITSGGGSLSLQLGAVSVPLSSAIITAQGVSLHVGSVTVVQLATAILTAYPQSIGLSLGEAIINLDTAALEAIGQNIGIIPGSISILLDTAMLLSHGESIDVIPGEVVIPLLSAIINIAGVDLSVIPGAVSVDLKTAELLADAKAIVISNGAKGAVILVLKQDSPLSSTLGQLK